MSQQPPPPPLSLRPAAHPDFERVIALAVQGEAGSVVARQPPADKVSSEQPQCGIWDVGCGFGKDLLDLALRGLPSSRLVGFDLEPRFEALGRAQARAAGFGALPYTFLPVDLFDAALDRTSLPPAPRVIIAYRLFHLFPPSAHRDMLHTLLSLLDTSSGPAYILGLHRALPSGTASGYRPSSTGGTAGGESKLDADKRHWLWAADEWGRLLRETAINWSGEAEYIFTWKEGPAVDRGAVEWMLACGEDL